MCCFPQETNVFAVIGGQKIVEIQIVVLRRSPSCGLEKQPILRRKSNGRIIRACLKSLSLYSSSVPHSFHLHPHPRPSWLFRLTGIQSSRMTCWRA